MLSYLAELWPFAILLFALLVILMLTGVSISVRHGQSEGKISFRSLVRELLGHRKKDRNNDHCE